MMADWLTQLNELPPDAAEAEFLKCCGSKSWAAAMSKARPFENITRLLESADRAWWSLSSEDWFEAFRAHPKIGEPKAETAQSALAETWSAQEQSRATNSGPESRSALANANHQYEEQFGFIFIICATGKSVEEIMANLHRRLQNDRDTELRVAAEEQGKITRLRLEKLLNK